MKVTVIAPYEGLKELINNRAKMYDFEVEVKVGDLSNGVKLAIEAEAQGTSVIISRGGTASLIQEKVSIPVVEIEVTGYDMIRVLSLIKDFPGKVAIVGFRNITEGASAVCSLLDSDVTIMTVSDKDDVHNKLAYLKESGFELIIGDVITVSIAETLGLGGVLLTSGEESISKAFQDAMRIHNILKSAKRDYLIPEQILQKSDNGILVYNQELKLVFKNLIGTEIIEELSDIIGKLELYLKELQENQQFNSVIPYAGELWTINGFVIRNSDVPYYAFKLSRTFDAGQPLIKGLYVFNPQLNNSEEYKGKTLLDKHEFTEGLMEQAEILARTEEPVWIAGDLGTGKDRIAWLIHNWSVQSDNPFSTLDCGTLTDNEWEVLLNSSRSFLETGHGTLFLKDIHLLNITNQRLLYDRLQKSKIISFRIISSSTFYSEMQVKASGFDVDLYKLLGKLTIKLKPFSRNTHDFQSLIKLYISKMNTKYGKQIVGIREDALLFMQNCDWPGNVFQFKRILEELIVISSGPYIELAEVRNVLEITGNTFSNKQRGLKMGGTLEEIERNIIQLVLEEEGMNQSKTAKRLGINRSTLWRKLK